MSTKNTLESNGAYQATPREELLRQLLDSRIPKNEREWCASREIEKLTQQLAVADRHKTDWERIARDACEDAQAMRRIFTWVEDKAQALHYGLECKVAVRGEDGREFSAETFMDAIKAAMNEK